ncbi:MAG: polysaccharide biosynthesis protein [Defluviitaleaceae bacterium]|nr:polysaccharide biosynthesis protein [Defluviitaleaceae bacterium]MCL2239174.1 polysaccharide biosynthesis protein [Defluviitaleaceae bacterium]
MPARPAPLPGKPQGTPFVRQAAIIAMSMFIGRLLGFVYRLPLTGLIGDEGNAWYTTSYAVYTVVLIIAAGALPTSVSKLVAERVALGQYRNAHGIFRTAMTFATLIGVAAGLGMWFGAGFITRVLHSPQSFYALRALAPTMLILGAIGAFRGYFLGMKSSLPVAMSQTAEQLFNVGFSLWLAFLFFDAERLHRSVAGAAAGTGIGALVGLLVLIGLYTLVQRDFNKRMVKDLSKPFESERTHLKVLFATTWPILLGLGLIQLSTPLDIGMANARLAATGAFSTEQIDILVGQFGMKFLVLTGLPVALAAAFSVAVIPEISASHSLKDRKSIRDNINTALRLAMVIAVPAAVGLAVMADPILALLFPSFPQGGILLQWGAASVVFIAINQILTGSLQGIGKVGMPLVAAFFGLLVKIPVNWFLMGVPGINVLGAVISTSVCFIVAGTLNAFFLYRTTGIVPRFFQALGKPVAAAAIMGVACIGLHRGLSVVMPQAAATILTLVLGVSTYVAAMMLIRGFREGDIALLPLPKKMLAWLTG